MTGPIDRLRSADPARDLADQPDARAEADLRLLLAEPQAVAAPAPRRERRRLAPVLVTAFVALAVIALTAAVLRVVHPRTDVGGATPAVTPTVTPDIGDPSCHPVQVLPFQCGTYESTYGGTAITGDLGGPAKDRLFVSFTGEDGVLRLTAHTEHCFGEQMLVRYDGERLIRVGKPFVNQNGCFGRGPDVKTWAYAFLNGALKVDAGLNSAVGDRARAVFFEYQGIAPNGQQQLPRNDTTCVPAHVAPFSCGTYLSSSGTGTLAFLDDAPVTLGFAHVNGQLTLGMSGWCNSLDSVIATDGGRLVSYGVGGTQRGCGLMPSAGATAAPRSEPEDRDDAWMRFFSGVLTYRIDGSTVTFSSDTATATFTSDLGPCKPASSPLCGTYAVSRGVGAVAFAAGGSYRISFGRPDAPSVVTVEGACGSRTYSVRIESTRLRLEPDRTSSRSCPQSANAHDVALDAFLRSSPTWRIDLEGLLLESTSGKYASLTLTRS